jgi:hypothetical protein
MGLSAPRWNSAPVMLSRRRSAVSSSGKAEGSAQSASALTQSQMRRRHASPHVAATRLAERARSAIEGKRLGADDEHPAHALLRVVDEPATRSYARSHGPDLRILLMTDRDEARGDIRSAVMKGAGWQALGGAADLGEPGAEFSRRTVRPEEDSLAHDRDQAAAAAE